MKILIVSPLGFPVNLDSKYVGIEKLVWLFARELVKRKHEVTVLGHQASIFPKGVKLLTTAPDSTAHYDLELKQFQTYQSQFRTFDVIHDFSHLHLIDRFMVDLPTLNVFWHAPSEVQYPKAPHNVIALSQWAAREFKRVYKHEARFQQTIGLDTDLYVPSSKDRNDRFLCVARMGEEKGNLNAANLCKNAGVPLDIITARGVGVTTEPFTDYEKSVMAMADGEQIKIWWENDYNEAIKIEMMQTNKALLYITNNPEVTSHKIQECLLCGLPVIVPALGALPEIVTQGKDGFLCRTEDDYSDAIQNVDKLNPLMTYAVVKATYSIGNVVSRYLPLYKEVAEGLRW